MPHVKDAMMAVPDQMALENEIPRMSMAKNVQPVDSTNSAPDSMPHGVNTCSKA